MGKVEKTFRKAAVVVLVGLMIAAFGPSANAGEETCWDCLVSTRAYDPAAPHKLCEGDIVDCAPCGHKWSKGDLNGRKTVTISATKEEIGALCQPVLSGEGEVILKRRYRIVEQEGKAMIGDRVTSLAVTPAEAKAAFEETAEEIRLKSAWEEPR